MREFQAELGSNDAAPSIRRVAGDPNPHVLVSAAPVRPAEASIESG
jgi:hypothetical protein